MSGIRSTLVGLAVLGAGLGGLAVTGPAASAAPAVSTGYDVCVADGTPVETGPGGSVTYTMNASQAWHAYDDHDNQWTDGYVQNSSPVQRGWVWGGHFDRSRAPHPLPNGTVGC